MHPVMIAGQVAPFHEVPRPETVYDAAPSTLVGTERVRALWQRVKEGLHANRSGLAHA